MVFAKGVRNRMAPPCVERLGEDKWLGNHTFQLLYKHGVSPCSATFPKCQRYQDLNNFPLENWRRPPGRPRTLWMKTIQQQPLPEWINRRGSKIRIVHSRDWSLRLVLRTLSGASQEEHTGGGDTLKSALLGHTA